MAIWTFDYPGEDQAKQQLISGSGCWDDTNDQYLVDPYVAGIVQVVEQYQLADRHVKPFGDVCAGVACLNDILQRRTAGTCSSDGWGGAGCNFIHTNFCSSR